MQIVVSTHGNHGFFFFITCEVNCRAQLELHLDI